MTTSIIIITLNEEKNIHRLVWRLLEYGGEDLHELIVVDGGSTDQTCAYAKEAGAKVLNSPSGRAVQMNYGAEHSTGQLLYFVHADTIPPESYMRDIQEAVTKGFLIGCFRFKFDSNHFLLKINSYFTRFDKMWCRGGDQSLFVVRQLFDELEGYDTRFKIMEEYDFIKRARLKYPFKIIPKPVLVSARKYDHNGYLRVQIANLTVFNMYRFGCSQNTMVKTYRTLLK